MIKHNNQLCPHRYPLTPGWREAIIVKCLAQGHKHHGRGNGSNPHSDDSAIRTKIQCTKIARPCHPIPSCKRKNSLRTKSHSETPSTSLFLLFNFDSIIIIININKYCCTKNENTAVPRIAYFKYIVISPMRALFTVLHLPEDNYVSCSSTGH